MSGKYTILNKLTSSENWLTSNWRPIAFYVYALICIWDFVIMPTWLQVGYNDITRTEAIQSSLRYTNESLQVLTLLLTQQTWDPLTLRAGGTFHLAFGAILGAASYTRGREKEERTKQLGESLRSDKVEQGTKVDNPDV